MYGVDSIDAEVVWGGAENATNVIPGKGGAGINVAVIDTGIDCGHPDLAPNCVYGVNIVSKGQIPFDDHGHGSDASRYKVLSGTSMATPYVSGTGALLMARGFANLDARAAIDGTAKDLGDPGFDSLFGYGRVDALRPSPVRRQACDAPDGGIRISDGWLGDRPQQGRGDRGGER